MTMYTEHSSGEIPNAETLEAMAEVEEMTQTDHGQCFSGSTENFFNMLMEFDD